MLYDKRWDKPGVKVDQLKIESLIEWLETMPPRKEYPYHNCNGACLLGQYLTACGFNWEKQIKGAHGYDIPGVNDFKDYVYLHVACSRPWTFGAALERARRAQVVSPQETAGG
jgi:hypothetical protein